MEYYKIFNKVLLKEIAKFKLDSEVYSTYVAQLTPSLTENFDVPYNRCAYMFRYATGGIYFFNDCIKKFLLEYSNINDLFSLWKSYSHVKVCSLSVGPGLDYLGLLLAVLQHDPSPPNFNGVKIVSKHGAWRNTVNLVLEEFRELGTPLGVAWPILKYENVEVIQADILKSYSENAKILPVSEANVILMMRTLNVLAAETTQDGPLLHMLKGMISSLEPGAIIFCIDTKPSLALITQALSHFPGKFLYGPIHQTVKIPYDLPEINKYHPSINLRGAFFAWQKLPPYSSFDLCPTPLSNIPVGTETKEDNLTATCNTGMFKASTIKDNSKAKVTDSENNSNMPWIELKSFWKGSSPKTKDLLKRLMLTNEESLEQLNDLISQSDKSDINMKNPLSLPKTAMFQDIESSEMLKIPQNITETAMLKDINVIQNQMQSLSVDSLHSFSNLQNTLLEGNSLSSSDTLNSVSSFTCENDSTSSRIQGKSTGAIPKSSGSAAVKNNREGNAIFKVNSEKTRSCENKIIQTDAHQESHTGVSSVKALTERIRQLAISLESVSQQNEPCNYNGGDSNETHNCQTESLHNFTPYNNAYAADKSSCSKQSPRCGLKTQDSLPSCESGAAKNNPVHNTDCYYNCQCFHNRCHAHCCSRSCDFQPCCAPQPVARCNFSCNRQQSPENNLGNFTSPTIVIPVQHISDNALLQIISVLKSESKN